MTRALAISSSDNSDSSGNNSRGSSGDTDSDGGRHDDGSRADNSGGSIGGSIGCSIGCSIGYSKESGNTERSRRSNKAPPASSPVPLLRRESHTSNLLIKEDEPV